MSIVQNTNTIYLIQEGELVSFSLPHASLSENHKT